MPVLNKEKRQKDFIVRITNLIESMNEKIKKSEDDSCSHTDCPRKDSDEEIDHDEYNFIEKHIEQLKSLCDQIEFLASCISNFTDKNHIYPGLTKTFLSLGIVIGDLSYAKHAINVRIEELQEKLDDSE